VFFAQFQSFLKAAAFMSLTVGKIVMVRRLGRKRLTRVKERSQPGVKALLQRVSEASVSVTHEVVGRIGRGLVVFVGVANGDTEKDAEFLAQRTVNLRIFADETGKFNLSVRDVKGELLVVSQFTLLADTKKGRRPSFTEAAPPAVAERLFEYFVQQVRTTGLKVETGRFQQYMHVEIHNDGPVTILLESRGKLGNSASAMFPSHGT
jgi:D-tyrosyl-tRNA(Tyr) deacylase